MTRDEKLSRERAIERRENLRLQETLLARAIKRRRTMPYREYLRSPYWQTLRMEVLRQAGHKCELCGCRSALDVHHRMYARRGNEWLDDLIVVCRECHEVYHFQCAEAHTPWGGSTNATNPMTYIAQNDKAYRNETVEEART